MRLEICSLAFVNNAENSIFQCNFPFSTDSNFGPSRGNCESNNYRVNTFVNLFTEYVDVKKKWSEKIFLYNLLILIFTPKQFDNMKQAFISSQKEMRSGQFLIHMERGLKSGKTGNFKIISNISSASYSLGILHTYHKLCFST